MVRSLLFVPLLTWCKITCGLLVCTRSFSWQIRVECGFRARRGLVAGVQVRSLPSRQGVCPPRAHSRGISNKGTRSTEVTLRSPLCRVSEIAGPSGEDLRAFPFWLHPMISTGRPASQGGLVSRSLSWSRQLFLQLRDFITMSPRLLYSTEKHIKDAGASWHRTEHAVLVFFSSKTESAFHIVKLFMFLHLSHKEILKDFENGSVKEQGVCVAQSVTGLT